jgi:hypothetical protein
MSGDPYFDDVVLLLGFEGGAPVDESPLANTVSLTGGASQSSAQAKYGTQSLLLTDGDDVCTIADHASFPSGVTPFTIELFVRFTASGMSLPLIGQWDWDSSAGSGWRMYAANFGGTQEIGLEIDSDGDASSELFISGATSITTGTWYHFCAEFDGTNYRLYADGVMVHKEVDSVSIFNSGLPIAIGNEASTGTYDAGYGAYFDEVRVTVGTARYASDGGFAVPTEAYPRTGEDPLDHVWTEGVTIEDLVGDGGAMFGATATDTMAVAPLAEGVRQAVQVLTDIVRLIAHTRENKGHIVSLADTVTTAEMLVGLVGVSIRDRIYVDPDLLVNVIQGLSLSDSTAFVDAVRSASPATLTDTITAADAPHVAIALQVIESLGIAEAASPSMIYGWSVADVMALGDTLANFFGGEITETISIAFDLGGLASHSGSLTDTVALAETVAPVLILRVTTADTIELTHEEAVGMIYAPTLSDGIEIAAAYISPGDGVTTWVMNSRTGAVTEYSNYAFNSFARIGHKYIGASDSGLYELVGDDDDGTDIVAQLKSGFAQWAGTRHTLMKGIYLGVRGEGDFVLKIITGEGNITHYGVSTRNGRSTKVNIGKGLRSRYFAFELISDGQDFDFDTIEFIPLVAQRRV